MTIVYNADGTSNLKCACKHLASKTWLNHWSHYSKVDLTGLKCQAKFCAEYAAVGAHVHEETDLRIIWICAFCQYHNKRPSSTPIELKGGSTLVGGSKTADCNT